MNRDNLKKNMLIKREKGGMHIYRVLAVGNEKVLVIDCIKKTMPVWMKIEKLRAIHRGVVSQKQMILIFWKVSVLM